MNPIEVYEDITQFIFLYIYLPSVFFNQMKTFLEFKNWIDQKTK